MKTLKILPLTIFFYLSSFAQTELVGLKVGDKVPNTLLSHIYKYKQGTAQLSDFKGKLIILDFWSTYCGPCLEALPVLSDMQREFKDRIIVLPVTSQAKEIMADCLNSKPSLKNVSLPFIYADKVLGKLFPYTSVPHDVIIGADGKVEAITDVDFITKENVASILNGKHPYMPFQKTIKNLDIRKPFFLDSTGQQLIQYHFMIAANLEGNVSTSGVWGRTTDKNGKMSATRIFAANIALLNLYRLALYKHNGSTIGFSNNRFVIDMADSNKFWSKDGSPDWFKKNSYCVDLIVPPAMSSKIFDCLREELDRYFDVHSQLDLRQFKCYALRAIDSSKFRSKGDKVLSDEGQQLWVKKKTTFSNLLALINERSNVPIIDKTGYTGFVDIQLKPDFNDIPGLTKQLKEYGLALEETYEDLSCIVISDRKQ